MAKSKKALSLVLAIVMAFSVFAFNAFAVGETADFTVTASKTENVVANDEIVFTVSVVNNYFLGPVSIPVHFDASLFEYVSYSVTNDIYTNPSGIETVINPGNGVAVISIYPDARVAGVAAQKFTAAKTLFTITLRAKTDISTATVGLDLNDARSESNPYGELVVSSLATADVKSQLTEYGQALTATPATIGAAVQPPVLAAKAGKTGLIDSTKKYVYGITPGEAMTDYFEATNGGSLTISGNGTGSTIELKNAAGTVVDTYTVIIFGDVNGDGNVNIVDATKIDQYVGGISSAITGTGLVAADVTASDGVNVVDSTKIDQYVGGVTSVIDQTVGFTAA